MMERNGPWADTDVYIRQQKERKGLLTHGHSPHGFTSSCSPGSGMRRPGPGRSGRRQRKRYLWSYMYELVQRLELRHAARVPFVERYPIHEHNTQVSRTHALMFDDQIALQSLPCHLKCGSRLFRQRMTTSRLLFDVPVYHFRQDLKLLK